MPAVELFARMRGQRPQGKAEILVDVELPGGVLLVVLAVLRLVGLARKHPTVDQELTPLIVAVASEQRVVEVEQREAHRAAGFYRPRPERAGQNRRWKPMRRSCGRSPVPSRDISAESDQSEVNE